MSIKMFLIVTLCPLYYQRSLLSYNTVGCVIWKAELYREKVITKIIIMSECEKKRINSPFSPIKSAIKGYRVENARILSITIVVWNSLIAFGTCDEWDKAGLLIFFHRFFFICLFPFFSGIHCRTRKTWFSGWDDKTCYRPLNALIAISSCLLKIEAPFVNSGTIDIWINTGIILLIYLYYFIIKLYSLPLTKQWL